MSSDKLRELIAAGDAMRRQTGGGIFSVCGANWDVAKDKLEAALAAESEQASSTVRGAASHDEARGGCEVSDGASQPLICKDCWPKKTNHYEPCPHVMEVYNAGFAAGKITADKELQALAKLSDKDIDTSDIPEVTDWSKAEVGKFYGGAASGEPTREVPECQCGAVATEHCPIHGDAAQDDLSPQEIDGIRQGIEDMKAGRVKSLTEIKATLAKPGFDARAWLKDVCGVPGTLTSTEIRIANMAYAAGQAAAKPALSGYDIAKAASALEMPLFKTQRTELICQSNIP